MREPAFYKLVWRDGAFVPGSPYLAQYCDTTFGEGEVVTFERGEEHSIASRNHYFASVKTAWDNLPESDERFPTPNALRKWALIRAGYCTESSVVCDSPEQAATIAAFTGNSEGTIVVVRGNIVKKYTARSQSTKGNGAMSPEEFQRSKVDVLDTIAELIAVKRRRLEEAARRTA